MLEKILFVDDDPIALEGLKLAAGGMFDATYALGPEQALEIVEKRGPFAVIVSDLKMPGINGVQFFTQVRRSHPETIRIMLTGVQDMDAAANAVNVGEVYRFYTKPCKPETLREALRSGIEKYNSGTLQSQDAYELRIKDIFNELQRSTAESATRALRSGTKFRLSPKELCIASFICAGASTKEIAVALSLSARTVESHRENIRKKLRLTHRETNLRAYLLSLLDGAGWSP
ncbi:hypothetical protein JCM15519_30560 [Fundidesulfovibrio butyratiphilus]